MERFQLVVHRETKYRPVYALVIAKGGPKFKVVKPEDEVSPSPVKGIKPSEGIIIYYGRNDHSAWVGRRVTMQNLADQLFGEVGTFVVDHTGFQGTFDLDLNYASDNMPAPNSNAPSIFMALQEQLGLKLEKETAPVEMLVVDHMEKKPTAN